MRRLARGAASIALACLALGGAPPFERGGSHPIASRDDREAIPIDWDDPDLAVSWKEIGVVDGRRGVRIDVRLRPTAERGSVWVGYPRVRENGAWKDAVHRLDTGRERTLRLQRGHVDDGALVVLVPADATLLRVPLGRRVVEIELGALAPDPPVVEVDDPFRGVPVERAPPRPARLAADLVWSGAKPFGDGALDAGERDAVYVEVRNLGERTVRGARVRIEWEPAPGVTLPDSVPVPDLAAGDRRKVTVPVEAARDAEGATRTVVVRVEEPFGHDAEPIGFELVVRAAPDPALVLLDDLVVEGADLPVPRDRIATVRLRVRNVGEGIAEGAVARIRPGQGVYPAFDADGMFELGRLGPGQVAELAYRCYANRRASALSLEVELAHDGARGPAVVERVDLPLEDTPSVPRIVRVQPDPRVRAPLAPEPAPLVSDVDRTVAASTVRRPSGLAVVIGVERYLTVPPASAASADARTAARYFERALGIPADRIEVLVDDDASLAQLQRVFGPGGWIERRMEQDTDLFVFFAGHGTASPERFVPYLLPVDADPDYLEQTGYPLDRLIGRIASLDARSATVFLDACFSGRTREGGGLLRAARPLVAVPAQRSPSGVAVFSAARGSQVASALDTEGHGLFSYWLFRGLGGDADLDADGAVTAGELKIHLEREVPAAALALDREQHPSILLDRPDEVLAAYAGGSSSTP